MGVVNTNHRAMIDKHCRIRFLCLKTSLCFVFSQLLQACYLHTLFHDEFWSTSLHCGTQQCVSALRGSDGGEVEGDSVSTMVGPACQYTFAKPISSQACSLISKMPMLCMQAHKRRSECGSALIMSHDQFFF